ncbi:MAG: uracil-DNA glycosylase [Mariprofundaceae bacterium]|nr:uracil-DNA glycosylase [Mariprofundaceae bacterium]
MNTRINRAPSRKLRLMGEFSQDYMLALHAFLQAEIQQQKIIYPPAKQWVSARNTTPFHQVQVVIRGQDPEHGEHHAHGLCFSVPPSIKIPPSLINIYKELQNDLDIPPAQHGCLSHWAQQGVLLLNSVLTVEQGLAASHQNKGWEHFTDAIIAQINEHTEHTVFILWGGYAQKKGTRIDGRKHLIIKAPHPSPLSVYRGFFNGRYFSRSNAYLTQHGKTPIDWALPDLNTAIKQYEQIQSIE